MKNLEIFISESLKLENFRLSWEALIEDFDSKLERPHCSI